MAINIARLDRAIHKVALLIDQSDDKYWPILDRLEAERALIESRQSRLNQYLRGSVSKPGKPRA